YLIKFLIYKLIIILTL
ncbi:hypothetical protein FOXB_01783, partial [Fusarium oxysporum f. sp. conglutinans Fo5176]